MEFWVGLVEKLSQMRHRSVVQIKKSFPSILKKNKNTIFLLFSKKGVPLGEKKSFPTSLLKSGLSPLYDTWQSRSAL